MEMISLCERQGRLPARQLRHFGREEALHFSARLGLRSCVKLRKMETLGNPANGHLLDSTRLRHRGIPCASAPQSARRKESIMSLAALHNRILDFLNAVNHYFTLFGDHERLSPVLRTHRSELLRAAGYSAEKAEQLSALPPDIIKLPGDLLRRDHYHPLDFADNREKAASAVLEIAATIVESRGGRIAQELRRFIRDVERDEPEVAYRVWDSLELDLEELMCVIRKRLGYDQSPTHEEDAPEDGGEPPRPDAASERPRLDAAETARVLCNIATLIPPQPPAMPMPPTHAEGDGIPAASPRGPRPRYDKNADAEMAARWDQAKSAGVDRKAFAKDNGLSLKSLVRLLDRVRGRDAE